MALVIQFREIPCKKGSWSVEEDNKLIGYIRKRGILNWNAMAKAAGLARTGKSCRLRWMNYLRPNLKHGNFTKEEDETILELHRKHGNKWTKIASKLSGRTDNDIKNHFNTRLIKIAEKESVKLHGSSTSSGQASPSESNPEYYTPQQDASSSLNPTSLEPSPTSSTDSSNFTSFQSLEEKEMGDYCWVDHQKVFVEMRCADVGAMSSDYEGYGLDEYCFYLQGGANIIFDDFETT